jgi:hypothetical protein
MCQLSQNKLMGPLPGAWSGMGALRDLQLGINALTGTVPRSWGSWGRVDIISVFANPQLSGCLPAAWRGKVNVDNVAIVEGPYKDQDPLTAGTGITGFC